MEDNGIRVSFCGNYYVLIFKSIVLGSTVKNGTQL